MSFLIIRESGDQSEIVGHEFADEHEALITIAKTVGVAPEYVYTYAVEIHARGWDKPIPAKLVACEGVPTRDKYYIVTMDVAALALVALYKRQRPDTKVVGRKHSST
jgi:hypothetical protein